MTTPRDNIEAKLGLTGPPLQTMRDAPPHIPDHELIRRIGQGAYGEVWLARNALGTWRAVKIVYRDNFKDARPYEREFAGIRRFEPLSRSNEGFVDILQVGRFGPPATDHPEGRAPRVPNNAPNRRDELHESPISHPNRTDPNRTDPNRRDELHESPSSQPEARGGWFYYVMELADSGERQKEECRMQNEPAPSGDKPHSSFCILPSYFPRTLSRDLAHRGRLPLEDCLELGLTLTLALGHLHRHGLIHRDIKPSNIIFVGGVPKLADIGLVTEAAGANTFVGTEGFVPPEGPTSPQADLYALGKVLYEAAMGKDRNEFPEPFTQIGTDRESVALMELNAVLLRACAPDPKSRYATAEEMHADLALLHSGGSVKRRHQFERQLKWAKPIGAAAAVALLLVGGLYFWQAREAAQKAALAAKARESELQARQSLYAADINLAQQALLGDNLRQARALLEAHIPETNQPDLRGFECRYLWRQAQGDEIHSLGRHPGGSWRVAFSPDGRQLATSGADQKVRVWDLDSHREIARLTGLHQVLSLNYSPASTILAAASYEGVWLWDTRTFAKLRELPDAIIQARFSPDGAYLLTLSTNRLLVWSTTDWRVVNSMDRPKPRGWEFALAFAPNENLFGVTVEGGVGLYTVPELRLSGRIDKAMSTRPLVSLAPDGKTIALDGPGFDVTLWDLIEQRPRASLHGHVDHVYAARFSPDGSRLATCSPDQTIRIWNVATGSLVNTLRGQADEVFDVAYSPDGRLLASVGMNDGSIKLWDASTESRPPNLPRVLQAVGFDRNSAIVTLGPRATVSVVSPDSLRVTTLPPLDNARTQNWIAGLDSLSANGRTLSLWDPERRRAEVWDLVKRTWLCAVVAENRWLRHVPGRNWLVTNTSDETATIWQLPSGEPRWVLTNINPAAVTFSPAGDRFVTDEGDHLRLWQVDETRLRPLKMFGQGRGGVVAAAFSPDGRWLATAQEHALIWLWELPSCQEVGVFSGHTRLVISLAFSLDSRSLASICDDRTTRLWHVATRRELLRFQTALEDKGPFSLRFSLDGQTLAASRVDEDGPISWVWFAPIPSGFAATASQ